MTNHRMREVPEADAAKVLADPILKERILKELDVANAADPYQLKTVPPEHFSQELARKAISFVPEHVPESTMCIDAVTLPNGEFEGRYPQMKR